MSSRLILIVAVGVAIFFYFSLRKNPETIAIGSKVPDFTALAEDGSQFELASMRGKVVLLNFWATYCHACTEEMPSLNSLASKFHSDSFQIIGISLDGVAKLAWPAISEYRKIIPINFPVVLDESGAVADKYGTYMIPESYLIDTQGVLIRKMAGAVEWDNPLIIKEITDLLSDK